MKKIIFLLLIVGMTVQYVFSQTKYVIPYASGIDTLYVKTGEHIGAKYLVFYEKGDQFSRGDAINGVIPFSSHGYTFWLKNVKMLEDTTGSITILSAIVSDDPTVVAMNLPRDDRTGGDMREPEQNISLSWWLLSVGCCLLFLLGFFRWKRWI